jgi:hypothetical protein
VGGSLEVGGEGMTRGTGARAHAPKKRRHFKEKRWHMYRCTCTGSKIKTTFEGDGVSRDTGARAQAPKQ